MGLVPQENMISWIIGSVVQPKQSLSILAQWAWWDSPFLQKQVFQGQIQFVSTDATHRVPRMSSSSRVSSFTGINAGLLPFSFFQMVVFAILKNNKKIRKFQEVTHQSPFFLFHSAPAWVPPSSNLHHFQDLILFFQALGNFGTKLLMVVCNSRNKMILFNIYISII